MRESKANPRASWEFYGIDKVQQMILKELMRSDEYASMVQTVAFAAN